MLTEEQLKKLISANESLRVQFEDANRILAAREQEIEFLSAELDDATALRSKLDGQLGEIESINTRLDENKQAVKGAEEREYELHLELTGMAELNKQYNELLQDYAYLQSRFNDIQAQLTALTERNFQLEQTAGRIGELESRLENSMLEREDLKNRISLLESQKYLKEFNL